MSKTTRFGKPAGWRVVLTAVLAFAAVTPAVASDALQLMVDGLRGPVVTDDPAPRLTWAPVVSLPWVKSWRVTVERLDATAPALMWIVPATDGPMAVLKDLPLPSRAEYRWQVEAIADHGKTPAPVRSTGRFEAGLKTPADWRAQWISLDPKVRERSAPLFRKPFILEKPVKRARLYVSGLGWHEAWLNGQRLGDGVLEPAQTDYEARVLYAAHDVTEHVRAGDNVLGVWVGDGWYNQDRVWGQKGLSYGQPCMVAQLEIVHADGSRTEIVSDETWQASPSAITSSNVYQGEIFDATRHDPAWSTSAGETSSWAKAKATTAPGGRLIASPLPPCRRLRTVAVQDWTEPKPAVYVANFGQNMTGWAKLRVHATPGTKITLRFSESLTPDGSIEPSSTGVRHTKQPQTDVYICRGGGEEIWEPRFTYHVFQYAEFTVENGRLLQGGPDKNTLEGVAVYTDSPIRAEFACSDPTIQRLFDMADWTTVGNLHGLPTDCPGRERCGWTGDAHLLAPFALRRYEGTALWRKYQDDIVTSAARSGQMLHFGKDFGDREVRMKAAGLPTMIAPGKRTSGAATPDWGSAIIFVPWDIYRFTGDARPLERHYASFVQWVEHLRGVAQDNILNSGLGDWCTPWRFGGPPPGEARAYYARIVPELSTACYWRSADTLARIAVLLGRKADAEKYRRLADEIGATYWANYYDPASGGFSDQTVNAIAVHWGLAPEEKRAGVSAALARQVAADGDHFYTGVFGLPSLFPALTDHGHDDTVARIIANPQPPGFRTLLARGATTYWEVWPTSSDPAEPYDRSKSHPFQGAWAVWCIDGIAGIRVDDTLPAFRRFRLAPRMVRELEWARCREQTPMGPVESSWRRRGNALEWQVEIPPGAEAEIIAPGQIRELTATSADTAAPRAAGDRVTLTAGRYTLQVELESRR